MEPLYLDDGSKWVPICVHNCDTGFFNKNNDFTKFNYETAGRYSNFDLINKVERPESG
jgi:hypothetical protein